MTERQPFAPRPQTAPGRRPRYRAILGKLTPLLLLTLATAAPGHAQRGGQFELTPFGSYTFGGSFEVFDFEFGRIDFELEDSAGYGVTLGIPINQSFSVEILVAQQPTELSIDEGLFANDFVLGDIDVDLLQGGVLWQGSMGQAKPFFVAGLGVARLSPDIPELDSETRPSFSIGGGVKTFFTPNFGLRFEGRLLVIALDEDNDNGFDCCRRDDSSTITQGTASVGLIFAF